MLKHVQVASRDNDLSLPHHRLYGCIHALLTRTNPPPVRALLCDSPPTYQQSHNPRVQVQSVAPPNPAPRPSAHLLVTRILWAPYVSTRITLMLQSPNKTTSEPAMTVLGELHKGPSKVYSETSCACTCTSLRLSPPLSNSPQTSFPS